MKKFNKIISLALTVVMLLACLPTMAFASLDTISVGDYVQMGTYYGEPLLWRCMSVDANGPLLIADTIICEKAFDASGDEASGSHARATNSGHYRKQYGSNYWADSNIRAWLNSTASAGNMTWPCGNAPVREEVASYRNEYDMEAGFLTNFTDDERAVIKSVTQKQILDSQEYSDMSSYGTEPFKYDIYIDSSLQNYDNAYSEMVTDKVFLLDIAQLNTLRENLGDEYVKGIVTDKGVTYSESLQENGYGPGAAWCWWLRTPVAESSTYGVYVRHVYENGTEVGLDYARQTHIGVRPAFYINNSVSRVVGGIGLKSSPYILKGEMKIAVTDENIATKYASNIVNVTGNVGVENAGKNATIILVPKESHDVLMSAKFIGAADVLTDGSYNVKFKANIDENDLLIVKVDGKEIAYGLTQVKDASEQFVELDISLDENNKVVVNLKNKYVDAKTTKLVIATYDENENLDDAKVINFDLAFGGNGEIQKYITENAVEGMTVKVFLWNSFTDMLPLAKGDSDIIPQLTVIAE